MPRSLPSQLTELLANPRVESHSTIDLVYSDASLTERHWSTVNLSYGGNTYLPYLKKIGDIRQTMAATTDRVKVSVTNNDRTPETDVASSLRYFDFAEATIGRYYSADDTATTHHSTLFKGRVVQPEVTEKLVTFDVVDSLVARGPIIGARPLTVKCPYRFKDPRTCKYAGSELTCNKVALSSDGCRGRNNLPNFGGWYFNYPSTATPPSGDSTDTGGRIGTNCFLGDTLITMWDGSQKEIRYVRPGDWVLAFYWSQELGRDVVTIDQVESVYPREAWEYFEIGYENGSVLPVTDEHPLYIGKGIFKAAAGTRLRQLCGTLDTSLSEKYGMDFARVNRLKLCNDQTEPLTFYNLHVRNVHTYFANRIAVHNKIRPDI